MRRGAGRTRSVSSQRILWPLCARRSSASAALSHAAARVQTHVQRVGLDVHPQALDHLVATRLGSAHESRHLLRKDLRAQRGRGPVSKRAWRNGASGQRRRQQWRDADRALAMRRARREARAARAGRKALRWGRACAGKPPDLRFLPLSLPLQRRRVRLPRRTPRGAARWRRRSRLWLAARQAHPSSSSSSSSAASSGADGACSNRNASTCGAGGERLPAARAVARGGAPVLG